MLSAQRVLDEYFLDTRCMLLEIAATLDRYDASAGRDGAQGEIDPRLAGIREALDMLADREAQTDRTEKLLRLFSDPVD